MGSQVKRIVQALSLTWSVVACGAPDAGTACNYDYHCISGSCTLGTCDAFSSCWPSCGEPGDDPPDHEPTPAMRDASTPPLDATVCKLRLCAELALTECRVEPGCEVTTRCSDAGVPQTPWTFAVTDSGGGGGGAPACSAPERCASSSWSSLDVRIHPLDSCF